MTELATQEGIVGFFDILGYANFLENNTAKDAAKIVRDILIKLPETVPQQINRMVQVTPAMSTFIKQIEWLVFSDTILITMPCASGDPETANLIRWGLFLVSAMTLYGSMFENGLPLRGAITYGEFVVQETCFAGKCIIDAYKLTHDLDLSIVALIDPAKQEFEKLSSALKKDATNPNVLAFEYLVALRNSNERKCWVLNPFLITNSLTGKEEIRQIVAESFWKHKKELSPKLMSKLDNTELFLRYAKMINSTPPSQ